MIKETCGSTYEKNQEIQKMNLLNNNYDIEGYLMLRTEILQYLEEYQTVRNMMYAVTGTLLTIGIGFKNGYLLLVPLLVIIPSYFVSINYEKCVYVAASYLKVFYERREDFPIKWESRLIHFAGYLKQISKQYEVGFNVQQFPYRVSALACAAIYLSNWARNHMASWCAHFCHSDDGGLTGVFDLILGAAALFIVAKIFLKIRSVRYEACCQAWEKMYQQEHADDKGNGTGNNQK